MRPSSTLSVKPPGRRGLRGVFSRQRSEFIELKGEDICNEYGRQAGERQGESLFYRSTLVFHSSRSQNIPRNAQAFVLLLEYLWSRLQP